MAVFISYRREDSDGETRAVYNRLLQETDARNLFLDVEAIGAGERWKGRIDDMLASVKAVLVVIGPRWLDALNARKAAGSFDAVRMEIAASLAKPGVTVFPVLVNGGRLPATSALPEDMQGLTDMNALEVRSTSWTTDVDRLIAALRKVGALRTSNRRWIARAVAAAAALIVIVAAVVGLFAMRIPAPEVPKDMAYRRAQQLVEGRGLGFTGHKITSMGDHRGMMIAFDQRPAPGSLLFPGQSVEVDFMRHELYYLVCRGGGSFDSDPVDGVYSFDKFEGKASATMRQGSCAWIDRAMNADEAKFIKPLGLGEDLGKQLQKAPGGLLALCAKSQYIANASPQLVAIEVRNFLKSGANGTSAQDITDGLCTDSSQ